MSGGYAGLWRVRSALCRSPTQQLPIPGRDALSLGTTLPVGPLRPHLKGPGRWLGG